MLKSHAKTRNRMLQILFIVNSCFRACNTHIIYISIIHTLFYPFIGSFYRWPFRILKFLKFKFVLVYILKKIIFALGHTVSEIKGNKCYFAFLPPFTIFGPPDIYFFNFFIKNDSRSY